MSIRTPFFSDRFTLEGYRTVGKVDVVSFSHINHLPRSHLRTHEHVGRRCVDPNELLNFAGFIEAPNTLGMSPEDFRNQLTYQDATDSRMTF